MKHRALLDTSGLGQLPHHLEWLRAHHGAARLPQPPAHANRGRGFTASHESPHVIILFNLPILKG
jgi:hypothetical protein